MKERTGFSLISASPEETLKAGLRLAKMLQPGDVVCLDGDLGAGKTHLSKGIAEGFGYPAEFVSSPTFAIVNEYKAEGQILYHFDCYRIEHPEEMMDIGWEDYAGSEGICIVEWPENIRELIPAEAVQVTLSHRSENEREIQVSFGS